MRKYIYYSSLVGVFSGALIYKAAFDIRFFYLIILSNLFLMALFQPLWVIPRWLLGMFGYLLLSGVIGIVRGTDTTIQVSKEFLGITTNAFFYYHFFKFQKNDYLGIFLHYTRISYWVCLLGFPIMLLETAATGQVARLHSITLEPAAFCELTLPAFFWYASQYLKHRKGGVQLLTFSVAFALSRSSLGYICVAFGIFLLPVKRKSWIVAASVIVALVLTLTYTISPDFRMRFDDTVKSLTAMEVDTSNLSTFALVSNLLVTERVFQESPLIGNGLGSHLVSHERIIRDVPGMSVVPDAWDQVNATDASSMTLRLISEQGLLGLGLVLWFIFKFHAGWRGQHALISNALLTTFLLKLIRGGIYFAPEQFFFIFMYLLNYRSYRREQTSRAFSAAQPAALSRSPV